MSEMVDRAAQAIVERQREMWAERGKSSRIYIEPLELARAAIEAMREPSEKMKDAGFEKTGDPCWPENVGNAWRAMIDAALA